MLEYTGKIVEQDYYAEQYEVARIEKSESVDIVITACTGKKGEKIVGIREWFLKNDQWNVGKAGINIRVDLASDLTTAINEAVRYLSNK